MRQLWLPLLLMGLAGASTIPSRETDDRNNQVVSPEKLDEYSDLVDTFDLGREFDEKDSQSRADYEFEEKDPMLRKEEDDLQWEKEISQDEDDDDSLEQDNTSEENEGAWEGRGRRKHLWRVNRKERPMRVNMKKHSQRRHHKHGLSTDDQDDVRSLGRRYRVAHRKTPEKSVFSSKEEGLTSDRELSPEERQEIRNLARGYRVPLRKRLNEKNGPAQEEKRPYRKLHHAKPRRTKGVHPWLHVRRNITQMGPRAHWRQAKRQHRGQLGGGNTTLQDDNSTQAHILFHYRAFLLKLPLDGTRPTMEHFCKMLETPRRMPPPPRYTNRRKDAPRMEDQSVSEEDLKKCCGLEYTEDRAECFQEAKHKYVDRCCEGEAPLFVWGRGPGLFQKVTDLKDTCCNLEGDARYICFDQISRAARLRNTNDTDTETRVPRRRWAARRQHRRRFHKGLATDEEISAEDKKTTESVDTDEDVSKAGAKPSRRRTKWQCCRAGKKVGVSLTTEPLKETCKAEADIFPEISGVETFKGSCKASFYWCCSRTAPEEPDVTDAEPNLSREESFEEDDDIQEPSDAVDEQAEDDFQEEYDDPEDSQDEEELEDALEEWDEELEKDIDYSEEEEPFVLQHSNNDLY